MKENQDKKKKNSLSGIGLITQIGISMATPIILCLYIGRFIDRKLAKDGLFTLIFILLGAGSGMVNLFKLTYPRDEEK